MPSFIKVKKLSGEIEPFYVKKVYNSALRVGATKELARKISKKIEKEAYQGITTSEIFKKVKDELKRENPQLALRFNLKQGIKRLGPAGFAFEKYVREILISYGFNVDIDKVVSGRCASYEVDFLASRNGEMQIGECKYKNNPGDNIDISICLKGFAELEDIKSGNQFSNYSKLNYIVVTNAKFTTQAEKYCNCKGLGILGWRHPNNEGLEYLIEKQKLFPITILPSLKGYLLKVFSDQGLMLVEDVLRADIEKLSKRVNIPEKQIKNLVLEARTLLGYNIT